MNTRYSCYFALLGLLLLLNSAQTVFAGETAWEDVAPGAQLRLISSNQLSKQGYVDAAIQLRMEPGWKTYWRIPGESGIPLTASWDGSTNINTSVLQWPIPKRTLDYGVMDYVFEGDLTIPLKITLADLDKSAILNARLVLGICSDICVPVLWNGQLEIDLNKPSAGHAFRVTAAYAYVPVLDDRSGAPFARVGYSAELDKLVLAASTDPLSNATLILDLPKTALLFDMPQSGPELGTMTVASLVNYDLSTLVNQNIRLTYDSAEGPFTKLVQVEVLLKVDGGLVFK